MGSVYDSFSRPADFGIILEKSYSLDLANEHLGRMPEVSDLVRSRHPKWGEDILFFTYRGRSFVVLSVKGASIAACAVEKVKKYGGQALVFIGTCGSADEGIEDGTFLLPFAGVRDEGTTSGYLDTKCPAVADPGLLAVLRKLFDGVRSMSGIAYTTDKRYREDPVELRHLRIHSNVLSIDMETAAVFVVSMYHSLAAAAIRIVTDCAVKETSGDLKGVYAREEPFEEFVNPKLLFALKKAMQGLVEYGNRAFF